MGAALTPPASPLLLLGQNIGGAAVNVLSDIGNTLFPSNPSIPGLPTSPPPAPPPVLPPTALGEAFTSNPTIQTTADELAAQALANLQVAASSNQPDPSLVVNKPVRGRPPDESDDPVVKSIQEALSDIYLLKKKVKTVDLNADEIKQLKNLTKLTNAYYSS